MSAVTALDNMADKEYRSANGISASDAKHIIPPKTPAHFAAHMAGEVKREQTRAMLMGTLCHLAVLEPEKLDAAFVERPAGIDMRTVKGKEFKAQAGERPILDEDETRAVRGIRDSIAAHKAAKEFLAGTRSEVSLFGQHRTGLSIKGRIDAFNQDRALVLDVKTTSAGADANAFSRQSFALNYHLSAAWYCHLARAACSGAPKFLWIAVEVAPPYAVAVYEIHPQALELGMRMMNDALTLIARCEDEGHWPGYGDEVQTLNLPPWAYKEGATQ